MRFFALKRIEGEDKLTFLFNDYMNKLFTADCVSFPRGSMSDYVNDKYNVHADVIQLHYELGILSNALASLRTCITSTLKLLHEYAVDYNFDWIMYAIDTREKYGTDETDFDENGELINSVDREFLKQFSIHKALLLKGFDEDTNSEMIGSSSPEHYTRFTTLVRKETDFCVFKMFSSFGSPLTIHRINEDGEMNPVSEIDRIEDEINKDIKNENIADIFELVIEKCAEAKKIYKSIDPLKDEKKEYIKLISILEQIQNLSFV